MVAVEARQISRQQRQTITGELATGLTGTGTR